MSSPAVTFDCYGTLIDWESGILAAVLPLLGGYGIEADLDRVLTAFARAESAVQRHVPFLSYAEVLRRTFAEMAKDLGFTPSVHDATVLLDTFDGVAGVPRHGGGSPPAVLPLAPRRHLERRRRDCSSRPCRSSTWSFRSSSRPSRSAPTSRPSRCSWRRTPGSTPGLARRAPGGSTQRRVDFMTSRRRRAWGSPPRSYVDRAGGRGARCPSRTPRRPWRSDDLQALERWLDREGRA